MEKKTVIITGANSGIGKTAAFQFARAGHTVVMGCRNMEKSLAVQSAIIKETGNEKIFLMQVDTSSQASIRSFAKEFMDSFERLDILINNAAYFNHGEGYRLSEDGIELTFATNVVGPYLLTGLLLEHLKKSTDARVLNVSSNIIKHFFSPKKQISFKNLQGISEAGHKHKVYNSYRDSKMAFLMLSFRQAEEYRDIGVKVNSLQVNGAKMSKNTLKKFKPGWRWIACIQNLFFRPPEFMANNYFELCTDSRFSEITGKHFNHELQEMKKGPEKPAFKDIWGSDHYPVYALDEEVSRQVWELCRELSGLQQPGH
jgi:NAD(P)-dependent dehydrogenase (short-subunit alcohol dehydrogenase family)